MKTMEEVIDWYMDLPKDVLNILKEFLKKEMGGSAFGQLSKEDLMIRLYNLFNKSIK